MTTSTKTVKVAIPAVNAAWKAFCSADKKIESEVRSALTALAKVIADQTAPATQIQKSIEGTGLTAGSLGYSKVKALPTWLALDAKHKSNKEWKKLTIDQQITLATKSYSLLGKGVGEAIATYESFKIECDEAQREKTQKAKESKGTPSASRQVKKNATLTDTLKSIYIMIAALDPAEIEDSHIEQFNEIMAEFEFKSRIDA